MMFGLPGACLAMYRTALPEKRAAVGGLLFSMALTSFLTGVTEPIEFTFMFLAPVLYAVHAVLTGLAMVLMHALNVHLGFGFSAGLFDYVLNFSLATNPLLLLPVGLAYFGLYFVLFRWFILRFNLKTLGREAEEALMVEAGKVGESITGWIHALGGAMNLRSVEACTTRLRLTVADPARINEIALKPLGSRGVLKLGDGAVQVVVGPIADQLAADIRAALRALPANSAATTLLAPPATQSAAAAPSSSPNRGDAQALRKALGGAANLARVDAQSTRLRVEVKDGQAVDEAALAAAGYRGALRVAASTWHVLVGPEAAAVAASLRG
jgi:PTS system N-acetylglucosamine-specific IIC component